MARPYQERRQGGELLLRPALPGKRHCPFEKKRNDEMRDGPRKQKGDEPHDGSDQHGACRVMIIEG
jgi:hypothetical protein